MRINWVSDGAITNGVDRGVLYLADGSPIPWLGLTETVEKADDTIQMDFYYDGIRFAFAQTGEDFGLSVQAWTYPEEVEVYLGLQDDLMDKQPRRPFGFSWRVGKGEGYLLHLVWNAMAQPNDKPYLTKNRENELSSFTWEFVTRPKKIDGLRPTAHLVVDTNIAPAAALEALEDLLYGTDLVDGTLPEPQVIVDLFLANAVLVVVDNGDGTWTATGPDEAITMLSPDKFQIQWPSALYVTPNKYKLSSM